MDNIKNQNTSLDKSANDSAQKSSKKNPIAFENHDHLGIKTQTKSGKILHLDHDVFAEAKENLQKQEQQQNTVKKNGILSFIAELFLIILVVWGIRSYIATPFQVEGNSMDDTLHDGEKIFINKIPTYFEGIERGDIIVFKPPYYRMMTKKGLICLIRQQFSKETNLKKLCGQEPQHYVKRIIGIAGDTIEIKQGNVYLTPAAGGKEKLQESYLNAQSQENTCFSNITCSAPKDREGYEFVVPQGKVFVLGDNRGHSSDSRSAFDVGSAFNNGTAEPFVPLENVVGKVQFIIWPPSEWRWFSSGQ